jgi:hypothetical protein
MIYGNPEIKIEDDTTDRVGLRTLILSQMWEPSRWPLSLEELDAEKPDVPDVPGGVGFIGEQTRRFGGAQRTFWTFEGINGDGKDVTFKGRTNSPDYSFQPGFAQVSLIKHPNWAALKKAWNGQIIDGQPFFPEFVSTTGASSGPVVGASAGQTNPLFGHTDFLRMEGTYSFRYLAFAYAVSASAIGKIATSLPGRPPTFADRNWLFAMAPFVRRGPILDITEVYWLSGAGGWPPQIYTDNPAAPSKASLAPTLSLT